MAPFEFHLLFYLGALFVASQLAGQAAVAIGAPRIIGYLLSGVLFGPAFFGVLDRQVIDEDLYLVTDIALAVVAFSIGGSLRWPELRQLGMSICWITFVQAMLAAVFVAVALAIALQFIADPAEYHNVILPIALVIGAISAATAPAAVMAVVHETRARGPLTTVLLGVVALDDAMTIVLFAAAMNFAGALMNGGAVSWYAMTLAPVIYFVVAAGIGVVAGSGVRLVMRFMTHPDTMLGLIIGAVLLASGVAITLDTSPLLACMTLGFFIVNLSDPQDRSFDLVEQVEEPLLGLFFALAGAHLDLSVINVAGWLAVVILLARFGGKLLGCYVGGTISRAPIVVRRNLGMSLLPQAGVTLGLLIQAQKTLPDSPLFAVVANAVLTMVILNELVTPFAVRYALKNAGETHQEDGTTVPGNV